MTEPAYAVVLVTAATGEEARKISGLLLERRKAACVNIVPEVDSRFWWQGSLDSARESLLVIKTTAVAVPEVIELVREAHSNAVPEIVALPIIAGNPDYLDWIGKEVG